MPVVAYCWRPFVLVILLMAGNVLHAQDTPTPSPTPTATLAAVETDRAALVAFYNATNGGNWTKAGKWLSEDPIGEWFGVSTDSSGRVTRLELNDNKVRGTIPAELGSLSMLTRLDLEENRLSGTIPAILSSLSEMTHLYLARNNLTGSIPSALGSLSKLRELDLLHNNLTGSIPTALGNLSELRHLDLMGNDLTGSIPNQLGRLSKLTMLLLGTNSLGGTIPPGISGLSNLSMLRLDYNNLTGSIPASLLDIGHLFYLGLSNNYFSGCEPAGLRGLASHHDLADLGLPHCSTPTPTVAASATQPGALGQQSIETIATPVPVNNGAINSLTLTSNQPGVLLVSWDAPTDTPDDYRIVWAKTGEAFPPYTGNVGNAYPTSPPYTITGLDQGVRYKVKLRARYDGRGADWTDIKKAVVMAAPAATDTPLPTATDMPIPPATDAPIPPATNTPIPPATNTPIPPATNTPMPLLGRPQNLTASVVADGVSLSWDAPAGQVDGYEILRRRRFLGEDSLQTLVADTGSSATTYTDSTATESTRYTYRVKAIRNGERSRRSNFARVDR